MANLGITYNSLEENEKSREYMRKALHIFEEIESPNSETIYEWLEELENE